jgi:two-component system, NarL family, nitrate/nitrite response regulator NarL
MMNRMQAAVPEFHALVVDDHPIVRDGVAQVLLRLRPGCRVSQAGNHADAAALLALHPDIELVVLDLHLPGQRTLQPLFELRSAHPLLAVMILSADEDPDTAEHALRSGAAGFVPKSANPTLLANALQLVLDGGCYVPPFLLAANRAPASPAEALTERQRDVLKMLVDGRPNKDIARSLGLAEPTVKAHLVNIFRILGVKNRAQAAMAGGRWLR